METSHTAIGISVFAAITVAVLGGYLVDLYGQVGRLKSEVEGLDTKVKKAKQEIFDKRDLVLSQIDKKASLVMSGIEGKLPVGQRTLKDGELEHLLSEFADLKKSMDTRINALESRLSQPLTASDEIDRLGATVDLQVELRLTALAAQLEELRQAKVYHKRDLELSKTAFDLQKIYKFLRDPAERTDADKQKIYDIALNADSVELWLAALEAFAQSMNKTDWIALLDIVQAKSNSSGYVESGYLSLIVSKDAQPCPDTARVILLYRIQSRALAEYGDKGELSPLTRALVEVLALGVKCFTRKELTSFIQIAESQNDQTFLDRLNFNYSKLD